MFGALSFVVAGVPMALHNKSALIASLTTNICRFRKEETRIAKRPKKREMPKQLDNEIKPNKCRNTFHSF